MLRLTTNRRDPNEASPLFHKSLTMSRYIFLNGHRFKIWCKDTKKIAYMQDFVHFLETKHLFVYLLYILNNPI